MAVVTLRRGGGRSLKAGGAWIYDNEIESVAGSFENGEVVIVHDFDGYGMGRGFINTHSRIRVRMLTRNPDEEVDRVLLRKRVRAALDYRKKVMGADYYGSCRLIFGEADFLPGLVVDKFADILVVQPLALGIDRLKDVIIDEIKAALLEDGISIRGVYERSDAKEREKEGLERRKGFIGEAFDTKVEIAENGVRYIVDVENGQKTGFFLDQKYNRAAVARLCPGARVLDCFTHTGSFALNAASAGANEALGVDASKTAVALAEENAVLNGLSDRVSFRCADVFELLDEYDAKGEKFDIVILDPPAFTKSRETVKKAEKGYREINFKGMKLVRDGGYLATCSCSHFMTQENFAKVVREAAHAAHVRLRQVSFSTQAPDHPILWAADESYYLKFYIFQICRER